MPYITKHQYEDYLRLKKWEEESIKVDALRMIVRECDYDPERIGKHFLEVFAQMKKSQK